MALKVISGYVRNSANGVPAVGVPVYLYHDNSPSTETAMEIGYPYYANNSVVYTDAFGFFKFTMELNPGPVFVKADLDGGINLRYRYGDEMNQAGSYFTSDTQPLLNDLYLDGLIGEYSLEANFNLVLSGSSRLGTLGGGTAIVEGYPFSFSTPRVFSFDPNTTLGIRRDLICLRQYTSGVSVGRQEVVVLKGTSNNIDPDFPSGAFTDYPLYRILTSLNAGVSTLGADLRTFSNPRHSVNTGGGNHRWNDYNFASLGVVNSTTVLGTALIPSVPPGVYYVRTEVLLSASGSGQVTVTLTGNGAPSVPDKSGRTFTLGSGVRQIAFTGRQKIETLTLGNVAATATLTLGVGAVPSLMDGLVSIEIYPE